MRLWPTRFGATIFEEPTRSVQILCGLCALGAGVWVLTRNSPVDQNTAAAVFYWFGDRVIAVILFVAAAGQIAAAEGPSWRLRYAAATLAGIVWAYVFACFVLTNFDSIAVPLFAVLVIAEIWITLRARHDRELNGADRRGRYE